MINILKNKNVLFNNTISLVVMQVFNFLPFIVVPFLARRLGADVYGEVISILAVSTFSYVFVDYGFNVSATYKISKNKNNPFLLCKISSNVITIRIIISFLLLAVFLLDYFLLNVFFNKIELVLYVFGIIFFQSLISDWFFQGIEKMFNIAAYTILIRIVYAASVLLLIKNPEQAYYVIIFWMLSNAIGALFSILLMRKYGISYKIPNYKSLFLEVKEGWLFFKARLSVSLYTSLNSVLLGIINPIYLAYYSIGDQAYKASQSVTSPINRALYPYMVRTKNWKLFFKIFSIILSIVIMSEVIFIYYASSIVNLIFGKGFEDAVLTFKVFMITAGITYVGVTFGNPVFGALGKLHIPNKISIYACFLHFFTIGFMYLFYSINHLTIAIALLITELFVAALRVYFFLECYNYENKVS